MSDVELWRRFRSQMPVTERFAYFDHAAVAPLPAPTRDALVRYAAEAASEGNTAWLRWNRRVEEVRAAAARLITASTEEVALVRNTTEGISIVAEGFPWQPGDNVVVPGNEFPSNVYPWLNLASRGVETRLVPVDGPGFEVESLLAAADERTRLIAVSWVGYATGWRTDVARLVELAHRKNILVLLDAIQGLGALPFDVSQTPVDFLAADGHKWLLGPEGAGILFVRSELLDRLRPTGVGWHSVVHASDYTRLELDLKPAAARYEGGSANMPGFLALGASIDLLLELGLQNTERRILEITDLACDKLATRGARVFSCRTAERSSGIVAFELEGIDPQVVRQRCLSRGVVLGCRAGRLRISPHAYVNEEDVERLVDSLSP